MRLATMNPHHRSYVETRVRPAGGTVNRRFFQGFLSVAFVLLAWNCLAAQPQKIDSESSLSRFMQPYYLHPRPDLVASAIRYLGSSNVMASNKSAVLPTEAFFSVIFSRYPSRRKQWSKLVSEQHGETRAVLEKALHESPQELIDATAVSPALDDMCWSAYFASGSLTYLNKIVDQLNHLGERKNLTLYLTAASAEWSLSSISRTDRKVRMSMLAMEVGDDPKMRAIAAAILKTTPEQIREQTIKVLKRQHKNGIW